MRGDFQSKIPSLAVYDHAIAYVPEVDLYLDGTAEFTGSSELPRMDLGAKGILLNRGNAKPVRLPEPDPKKNVIVRELDATLDWEGGAKVKLAYEVRGVDAAGWRQRYHNDATRRERVTTDLGSEFKGFKIDNGARGLGTGDLGDYEAPATLSVSGQTSGFARKKGTELSMMVTVGADLTPTYASLSSRKQDVRILAFSTRKNTTKIRLPAGAQLISKPPQVKYESEFGAYSVNVEVKAQEVLVTSHLEIRVSRVSRAKYAAWKQFCTAADEAMSHPLVISR
jgi:hypothetical protein